MGILAWIIFGAIAGWIASLIAGKKKQGCFVNIIVGIVGAVIGGFIIHFITGDVFYFGFNLISFAVAIVGSIILLILAGLVSKK